MVLLVDLGQACLGKGGACPEEGDNPHPHDGSRASETDGQCHTDDVAGAHAAREGEGEGLEGGDASPLGTVVLEEETDHLGKVAHLHETGAEGEVESSGKAEPYERPTPYTFVEKSDYFVHV